MDKKKRQVFHIYLDESSKNAAYFGVGAILCENSAARDIADFMSTVVTNHGERPDKEIHWNELTKRLLPLYLELGRGLIGFTQNTPRKMRYKAIIVESKHIRRDRAKSEKREDIIAKFVFTLVYMIAKEVGTAIDYHVFVGSPSGDELDDERTRCSLNNRCKSQLGIYDPPFKKVRSIRSEKRRLIQAVDLITGPIAYEMNGLNLAADASAHRLELWSQMLAQSKLASFAEKTTHFPPQFQIQHFDFLKSKFTRFAQPAQPQLKLSLSL